MTLPSTKSKPCVKRTKKPQKLIQGELKRPPGGNNNPLGNNQHTKKEVNLDNIQDDKIKAPTGTSRAAGLRRLEKDRPDLLAEVIAGKMAVNGAMVEAGFRKKTVSIPVDVKAIAAKLRRALSQDQIQQLIELLQAENNTISATL